MNDVAQLIEPPHCRPQIRGLMCLCLMLVISLFSCAAIANEPTLDLSELIKAEADQNGIDLHQQFFTENEYTGTESCLLCHAEAGEQMLDSAHFKWVGEVQGIPDLEGQQAGKLSLLNNFCIATATNEGRCTQCHVGYGWKDDSFDFNDPTNIDCLVCHDQTGTYKKAPTTAGLPLPTVDLQAVAQGMRVGARPPRENCIGCHAFAGGGDNVKHGDISSAQVATTRDVDVHMGTNGGDMLCVDCHAANHDPKTGAVNHGIAGQEIHSVYEGEMRECTDCHGSVEAIHRGTTAGSVLFFSDWHDRLACQTCHLPEFAKTVPTKMEWYWEDAGQNISPIPIDPATGMPTYDKKKGTFVWKNNVRPQLRWYNGSWERNVLNVSDTYDEVPIQIARPLGDRSDPDAMIYPFKMMIGNQPVDPVNQRIMVPHLFGTAGGPNPYWGKFDWDLAIQDGVARTGQPYSGTYGFEDTVMFLTINHEIAPAEDALGKNGLFSGCLDCHGIPDDTVDWEALGWTDDPLFGGEVVEP